MHTQPRSRPYPPTLGLDIGGTKLAAGVLTDDGTVHGFRSIPTHREEGPRSVIRRLFDLGHEVIREAGLPDAVEAVGISCGGPLNSQRGVLAAPVHLPDWVEVPITRLTSEEFGKPAQLHNDATACALAEYRYGLGRDTNTLLYLTISTGIGGGAVVGGRLMLGAAGNGGEFGHVLVRPDGRLCPCGRRGCMEVYCSGTNIAVRAREALAENPGSSLHTIDHPPTAADVAEHARRSDPLALAIWDETIELLGSGLTDLVNVFEPDIIVLGGGVTRSPDLLLEPLRQILLTQPMRPAAAAVTLALTSLGDANGVVGAGTIAQDRLTAHEGAIHAI